MRKDKVAVYSRTAFKSHDVEIQKHVATQYLKENGFELQDVIFVDDLGVPAPLEPSKRTGLNTLKSLVAERKVDTVITYSWDRFGRKAVDTFETYVFLKEHQVNLIFLDGSSPNIPMVDTNIRELMERCAKEGLEIHRKS